MNWYLHHAEKGQTGPFTLDQIRSQLASGKIQSDILCWKEGMEGWEPLEKILNDSPTANPLLPAPPPIPASHRTNLKLNGWAIASLVLAITGGSVYFAIKPAIDLESMEVIQQLVVLTLFLIVCGFILTVSVVCGGIACGVKRPSKAVGITSSSLSVLMLIWISTVLSIQIQKISQKQIEESRERTEDDVTTRPIPQNPNAKTQRDYEVLYRSWKKRTLYDIYDSSKYADPKWNTEVHQLFDAWTLYQLDTADAPSSDTLSQIADSCLTLGCKDPVVTSLAGRFNPQLPYAIKKLDLSQKIFDSSPYPLFLRYDAHLELYRNLAFDRRKQKRAEALLPVILEQYQALLKDTSFVAGEGQIMARELDDSRKAPEELFNLYGDALLKALSESHHPNEWVCDYLRGVIHKELAWKERGTGYANTVTDAGWQGMKQHLLEAEKCLVHSYQLNPDVPEAATEMITVKLGQGGPSARKRMRKWFDHAVNAQFDYLPAYNSMRYGLWPRWYGSDDDIHQFGVTCLETKRFDTKVPREFIRSLTDLKRSSKISLIQILKDENDVHFLQDMYQGYFAAEHSPMNIRFLHSEYAGLMSLIQRWDVAFDQYQAVHFDPDITAGKAWGINQRATLLWTCAKHAVPQAELDQAEEWFQNHDASHALEVYQKIFPLAAQNPQAKLFVQQRIGQLRMESLLAKGDWIPLVPHFDDGSWEVLFGDAKTVENDITEIHSGIHGHLLQSRARVGSNFEVEGEIDFIQSSNGEFQGGIVFGEIDPDLYDWISFRIKKNSNEGEKAYFSRNFNAPTTEYPITFRPRNHIWIQVWDGKLTAYLNGKLLISEEVPSKDAWPSPDQARIGFGGFYNHNETTIRYQNFKLRKIYSKPKPPENLSLTPEKI